MPLLVHHSLPTTLSFPNYFPPLNPSDSNPEYSLLQTHPSLSLLTNCKSIHSLKQIHAQFIKTGLHNTQFALSKLIDFCALNASGGDLAYARSIFASIPNPNRLIWNTMIRGHSLGPDPGSAIGHYTHMLCSGLEPNSYTFPFVLKSCAKTGDVGVGKQVHGQVLKLGLSSNPFVHTSIINMYTCNGELGLAHNVFDKSHMRDAVSFTTLISGYATAGFLDEACRLFDEMPSKDVVAWNAMMSGYSQMEKFNESLRFFEKMLAIGTKPDDSSLLIVLSACAQSGSMEFGKWVHGWMNENGYKMNTMILNALIDMYSKCGDLDTARRLFDSLRDKNLSSWNIMIGGYTHNSIYKESLSLFREMQLARVDPIDVTLLNVLPACAHLGAIDLGRWIHAYIDTNLSCRQHTANTSLRTSLIDMYAKCGDIDAAKQVFDSMEAKTLASWNAIISGLGMHGQAHMALDFFAEMVADGFEPDDITFVAVLSACTHGGLVNQARELFSSMTERFGLTPKLQHYGCMINLLGRAGLFDEAETVIQSMEQAPDSAIWGSLLYACKVHGKTDLAKEVSARLFELEPNNPGAYVLLSNMYAKAGMWDEAARVRTRLNDREMKKVPGCTSIEVDGIVHEFLAGDKLHPQSKAIYLMADEIDKVLAVYGFVPDTSEVLHDMDDEECKEGALSHHSERLAIAFGLISTKTGSTIRIVKNLRVCKNCHEAIKVMSRVSKREIIARDRTRFHHFKDGSCSCMDYW